MRKPNEISFSKDLIAAIFGALAYLLVATGNILLTADGHRVATIWPANALLLAIVLSLPMRRWPIHFLAAFAANAASNLIGSRSLETSVLFALVNLAEVGVGAALLHHKNLAGNPLENVRSVMRFLLYAGLVVPVISAFGGAAVAYHMSAQPFWSTYRTWFIADALGFLIFTPLFSGVISGELTRWIGEMTFAERVEAAAILILVTLAGFLTFFVVGYPMLFVLMAPVTLATFRLGPFGAKLSLIIAATFSVVATMYGYGPIAAMITDRSEQALFVQIYLATMLLTTLPASADLNARRALARRLAASEASARLLASESADVLVRLDRHGECVQSSGATGMLLGVETRELVGKPLSRLIGKRDRSPFRKALQTALTEPGAVAYCEFRAEGRSDYWLECTLRALVGQDGHVEGAIGAIRDITMRKERELSLSRAASTDGLTGALNHGAFMARLDNALASPDVSNIALLMIDIDHFKRINDGFGHPAGDKVLVELCRQLRSLIRDSDVIGRLGGDEIAILLQGTVEDLALSIAEGLRTQVQARPIALREDVTQTVSISCGVAQASPGITRTELLRKADDALYRAKDGGRGRVVSASQFPKHDSAS